MYKPIFGEDMMQLIADRERQQNPTRPFSMTLREMAETCASLIAATIQPIKNEQKRTMIAEEFILFFNSGYQKSLEDLDMIERRLKDQKKNDERL